MNHQPPMKQGSFDDFQTPEDALEPILPYLKKEWIIWECAEGKMNLSNKLFRLNFNVVGSDIKKLDFPMTQSRGLENIENTVKHYSQKNFLHWQPEKFECIITNPPFSIKQKFLERCYQLGKPFALLLPLTTFETYKRQTLFKKYGLQVIFFDKRIKFETPSGKRGGGLFSLVLYCLVYFWSKSSKRFEFCKIKGRN